MTRLVVATLVAIGLLVGCSAKKEKLGADEYYKNATEAFTKENYPVAVNNYKDLLDQYPFSEHAEEAAGGALAGRREVGCLRPDPREGQGRQRRGLGVGSVPRVLLGPRPVATGLAAGDGRLN